VISRSGQQDDFHPSADGLSFVQTHPEMFKHLVYDAPSAAALLTEAALRGGAVDILVWCDGTVAKVYSETDWLLGVGDRDPFTQLIPVPALGVNSVHPEVIVAAFSSALTTIANGQVREVVGSLGDFGLPVTDPDRYGRWVIFKIPDSI
jgi:pimeloyl-ACP methyl ester carboxylesterase